MVSMASVEVLLIEKMSRGMYADVVEGKNRSVVVSAITMRWKDEGRTNEKRIRVSMDHRCYHMQLFADKSAKDGASEDCVEARCSHVNKNAFGSNHKMLAPKTHFRITQ